MDPSIRHDRRIPSGDVPVYCADGQTKNQPGKRFAPIRGEKNSPPELLLFSGGGRGTAGVC